jgi:hypothetical protein
MKRHVLIAASVTAALGTLLGSQALAVGPALHASNHAQWDENAYDNGFGGALPAGIVEGSAGFSTIGDFSGRTVALAGPDITTNMTDNTVLTTIATSLFAGTDANLYEVKVTNPATFSVSIPSTSLILAMFNSTGGAIAASVGGPTDALTGANTGITSPGLYWIGIADQPLYPQNAAAQNLFALTNTSTGVFTPAAGITDLSLATDPNIAWTLPNGDASPLLSNTSFLAPSSTITIGGGAGFAVVPEPASIGLLSVLTVGLLGRRRRTVG